MMMMVVVLLMMLNKTPSAERPARHPEPDTGGGTEDVAAFTSLNIHARSDDDGGDGDGCD